MTIDNDDDLHRTEDREAPLDPGLAARLRIAEAEVRSHLDAGIWTPRRVITLVLVVLLAIAAGFAILYMATSVLGKHGG